MDGDSLKKLVGGLIKLGGVASDGSGDEGDDGSRDGGKGRLNSLSESCRSVGGCRMSVTSLQGLLGPGREGDCGEGMRLSSSTNRTDMRQVASGAEGGGEGKGGATRKGNGRYKGHTGLGDESHPPRETDDERELKGDAQQ